MRISDLSSNGCSSDLPAAPHRENGPARIICVGRLSAEKGYFGLLDALAAVGPSNGGAELVVVGDGPMAAAVRARARELGLLDRIRFAGARAEIGRAHV